MPISYRTQVDWPKRDDLAARLAAAHGAPHVPPSTLHAFRFRHRLSCAAAAELVERKATWWQWREAGNQLMKPEDFARVSAAAADLPPPAAGSPASRAALAAKVRELERRVAALEARLPVRENLL